jgi:hypothetical protein
MSATPCRCIALPAAAAQDAAVDARVHVADHIRLHPASPVPARTQAGWLQSTQSQTASPMTSSRSRPFSHGNSSVNKVTHCRHEQGIRLISVPQNIRSGPNASKQRCRCGCKLRKGYSSSA